MDATTRRLLDQALLLSRAQRLEMARALFESVEPPADEPARVTRTAGFLKRWRRSKKEKESDDDQASSVDFWSHIHF